MAEIGRLVGVGIGREATRGVAETTAEYWIPRSEFDFAETIEYAKDESSLGRIESQADAKIVSQYAQGTIGGPVRDRSFGAIMEAVFGSRAGQEYQVTAAGSGVWDHEFKVANHNAHQSMTIITKGSVETRAFPNGMLNSLELSVPLDDFVQFSSDWVARQGEAANDSVAYLQENLFTKKHVKVKFADTLGGLASASGVAVSAFSFSIEKNVEPYWVVGSVTPEDIHNHQFSVNGEFEVIFEDVSYRDYVVNGTQKACRVTIENDDVTIGGGSLHPRIEFDFPQLVFENWTPATGNDDLVTQTIAFSMNYSVGDSAMVIGKIRNTVSAAYAGS